MHLQLEIHHLRLESLVPCPLRWLGEMDGTESFDRAALDTTIIAGLLRILAKEFYFMTNQRAWQEGICIHPDLAIGINLTHLHPDLIGVANDHCRGHLVLPRVGIDDDTGIALELMDRPGLRHELLKIRLQHPVGHRCL